MQTSLLAIALLAATGAAQAQHRHGHAHHPAAAAPAAAGHGQAHRHHDATAAPAPLPPGTATQETHDHATMPQAATPDAATHHDHAAMGHGPASIPAAATPAAGNRSGSAAPVAHPHGATTTEPHDHAAMGHGDSRDAADPHDHAAMGHGGASAPASADPHSGHAAPLPRTPIPVPTEEDFRAAFPVLKAHSMQHASGFNSLVLFDHLEAWDADPDSGQLWSMTAWFGGDIDRLWLSSKGERLDGRTEKVSLDALYGHAVSPWWDVVAGVRIDNGHAPSQVRAAFGVQGMTPYKFEASALLYAGGDSAAELRLDVEYDVLLSNRLILQPALEVGVFASDDARRGIGSGLSHGEAGLRLRYEITRRFAPYVGFVHERRFGDSAALRRAAGESVRDSRWVAGVRFWF